MHPGRSGNMFDQLRQCYKGKKVLVTGHTGFKGSWLLMTLQILGAEVRGYALSPERSDDLFNLINGDHICDSIIGDLRDRKTLTDVVLGFRPDFIFHMAAQPLVRLSYETPSETFEINAIGTANLLDAVRFLNIPCSVVLITTDKIYFNNEWEYPYRENDRLGGYDPYSASKACAELVIDSYRNSFFNLNKLDTHSKGIAVARAGNVIGGGDWSKDRLIPDIARAFGTGSKVIVRNPHSIRPWQHVMEPLLGYLMLGRSLQADPEKFSQAFNFGPRSDDALSVLDMVQLTIDEWPGNNYEIRHNMDQPHEAHLLMLDISKAKTILGWQPRLSAREAIAETISWYRDFYRVPEEIIHLTESQVRTFLNAYDIK